VKAGRGFWEFLFSHEFARMNTNWEKTEKSDLREKNRRQALVFCFIAG
jgi:hypothetical protein